MHKHHEKTLAKLKEEHMWSVNHLKRSVDKEKELMRVQIEAEVRKQISLFHCCIFALQNL